MIGARNAFPRPQRQANEGRSALRALRVLAETFNPQEGPVATLRKLAQKRLIMLPLAQKLGIVSNACRLNSGDYGGIIGLWGRIMGTPYLSWRYGWCPRNSTKSEPCPVRHSESGPNLFRASSRKYGAEGIVKQLHTLLDGFSGIRPSMSARADRR